MLATLTPFPALRQLQLARQPKLTGRAVVAAATRLPSLAFLDLRKCRASEVTLVCKELPDVYVWGSTGRRPPS